MNNKFKSAIIFTLLLSILAFAAEPDAVYKNITEKYQITEDGRIIQTYEHQAQLNTFLTTTGHFPDQSVVYNPDYQELEITEATTIMKDGTKNTTPKRGFNEVMIDGAVGAPQYSHLRRMVVSHTGVERGCQVNFAYKLTSQSDFLPGLMGSATMASRFPINQKTVQVITPENLNLQYKLFNSEVEPTVENKNGNKIYTWTFQNLAAQPQETMPPDYKKYRPYLVFSTLKSWSDVHNWMTEDLDKKLKLTASMQEYMQSQIKDIQDRKSKVFKLQEIVNSELGNAGFDPAYTGYRSKPVSETWNHNTGNPLDKAFLLAAFLREIGINAEPVLLSSDNIFAESVPGLMQFGNVAVQYKCQQKWEYLTVNGYQKNNQVYQLKDHYKLPVGKKYEAASRIDSLDSKNSQYINLDLNIDENSKISGQGVVCVRGYFNPFYQLYQNDDFNYIVAGKLGDLGIKETETKTLSPEMSKCSYKIEEKELESDDNYLRIDLPEFNNSVIDGNFGKVQRNTPLQLDTDFSQNMTAEVTIPDQYQAIIPDIDRKLENEAGSITISFQQKGSKVEIKRQLNITKTYFTPSEYDDFHKLMQEWKNPVYHKLVIKTN
ncbi:MAG: DUF3857 domain-containing protein [Candidatus Marinimicrobia bacterium]|nr:DUF3857 domain-containing protein [Candidatus Neomarinimicrobiota bacterium]